MITEIVIRFMCSGQAQIRHILFPRGRLLSGRKETTIKNNCCSVTAFFPEGKTLILQTRWRLLSGRKETTITNHGQQLLCCRLLSREKEPNKRQFKR